MYQELDLPAKVKIGVSGCPRCCGESYVRDIGIFGSRKGWTVLFGGNSAGRPKVGNLVARDLSREEVIDLTRRLLEYYRNFGKPRERTGRFMERVGFEALKSDVLRYAPYIRLDEIPRNRSLLAHKTERVRGRKVPGLRIRPHPAPTTAEVEIPAIPAFPGDVVFFTAKHPENGLGSVRPDI